MVEVGWASWVTFRAIIFPAALVLYQSNTSMSIPETDTWPVLKRRGTFPVIPLLARKRDGIPYLPTRLTPDQDPLGAAAGTSVPQDPRRMWAAFPWQFRCQTAGIIAGISQQIKLWGALFDRTPAYP